MEYIFSVVTRGEDTPQIDKLNNWLNDLNWYPNACFGNIYVARNCSSIYEGHAKNIEYWKSESIHPNPVVVMLHDDVTIEAAAAVFDDYMTRCFKKDNTGFVGVAGTCLLGKDATWWNGRHFGRARGTVFQGSDMEHATVNHFGPPGQVVVLDGLLLACKLDTLMDIGLEKPDYLTSNWDFYDLHMTLKAHQMGLNNYVAPIITCHQSPGNIREEWIKSNQEFRKKHSLPVELNFEKTHGLPN